MYAKWRFKLDAFQQMKMKAMQRGVFLQWNEFISQMNLKFLHRFMTNWIQNPHLSAMDGVRARLFVHFVYAI